MTPERFRQINELFEAALEHEPSQRAAFLEQACAGDPALHRQVEALVASHEQEPSFLESPTLKVVALSFAEEEAELVAGHRIGPYQLLREIGRGGMGEVYLARDKRLGRQVALKFLPASFQNDPDRRARLLTEARAASRLHSARIASIHDIGEHAGRAFIVMEYVEGEPLSHKLKGGPLAISEAMDIAMQVAEALEEAHGRGIVHRDIKSSNLMITPRGEVKVLDFGLAKVTQRPTGDKEAEESGPTKREQTAPGVVMGTVHYMSPEQARGLEVDGRSDLFSLGAVLYELVAGRLPFEGETSSDVLAAILERQPEPLRTLRPGVPASLEQTVMHCLEKDREARYQSAAGLRKDLTACQLQLAAERVGIRAFLRKPRFLIPALVLVALVSATIAWYSWRASRVRWARTVALPEIARLLDRERTCAALRLVGQAERYMPKDPELERIRQNHVRPASFRSDPAEADVYIRDYLDTGDDVPWEYLGRTPLEATVIPGGLLHYRIAKAGFNTVEGSTNADASVKLDPEGTGPAGMVRVPAQKPLEEFWLDKYEVTNRQFKEFLTGGGYEKRDWWKDPFVKNGRVVAWAKAMAEFKDATGRPGPATWEFGTFPKGRDDYPVGGVSWYEAAAYCEFAGKSLPTVHHWQATSGLGGVYASILQLSNFSGHGPAPVGSYRGLGPFGTYDTAGNVREWCWNAFGAKRYILGGAWSDPDPKHTCSAPDVRLPFDRSAINGFRCAKYASPPPQELTGPTDPAGWLRDRRADKPAAEALFQVYKAIHAYDRSELKATIEAVDDTFPYWRKEKITFLAAYGNERVTAYLFLPKNADPPFQAVIYFPHAGSLETRSSDRLDIEVFDFLIRSGRAVMYPIYKGTYERTIGVTYAAYREQPNVWRELAIQWYKDLGRSIDYLETRPDIDREKLAYQGVSMGAAEGPRLMALEPRMRAGVLLFGGALERHSAEVDAFHFAPRSRAPTLMVNGRDDLAFPLETSQIPLFRLLGAAEKDKRHFVVEGGHAPLNQEVIRETLEWLDRYLGPVKTR
jgi:formylglycine-generating enzyme required for sulfatase activity/dienelactone hydrolase/predicted Ser/Thr protein kinase